MNQLPDDYWEDLYILNNYKQKILQKVEPKIRRYFTNINRNYLQEVISNYIMNTTGQINWSILLFKNPDLERKIIQDINFKYYHK